MRRSHRRFVSYIDASRDYYAAMGYEQPYTWATHDDVAFTPMPALADATIGLVTTTALPGQPLREPFHAPTSPPPTTMATTHLHWHHDATHTDDLGAFLPIDHLNALADDGVIGSLAPRFHGLPTIYSQRRTATNAHALAEHLAHDGVDLAVLIPL